MTQYRVGCQSTALSGPAWEPDPSACWRKSRLSEQGAPGLQGPLSLVAVPVGQETHSSSLLDQPDQEPGLRTGSPALCTRWSFMLRHKHFTQDMNKVHRHSRGMGICGLEARKQDVIGEQWGRGVWEGIRACTWKLELPGPSMPDPMSGLPRKQHSAGCLPLPLLMQGHSLK